MLQRLLAFVATLLVSAALLGCAPKWSVVVQAAPNPFVNQRSFAVLPIDYTGLQVGAMTEAQYLGEKDADQQKSFLADKVALNEEFAKALIENAGDSGIQVALATPQTVAPFLIRPHVEFIEPGSYFVVGSVPSEVRMTVRITAPDGRVLDEVLIKNSTDSKSGFSVGGISMNPSSGGRLRDDGEGLGETLADYLKARALDE